MIRNTPILTQRRSPSVRPALGVFFEVGAEGAFEECADVFRCMPGNIGRFVRGDDARDVANEGEAEFSGSSSEAKRGRRHGLRRRW